MTARQTHKKIEREVKKLGKEANENKHEETKEEEYIHELEFLSETAMEFLKLSPENDLYQYVAGKLHEIADDCIVGVSSFDEESQSLHVRAILGLGKHADAAVKIMGQNPVGRSMIIDDEAKRNLITGRLHKVAGGIYALSPEIPKFVWAALEKLFYLDDVYSMGFSWRGRLYGNVTILSRKGCELKNQGLIEAFIRQGSVALQRNHAEEALKHSEEEYRTLTEFANDSIVVIQDEKTIYRNPTYERLIGHTVSETMDRSFLDFIVPEDRELAREYYLKRLKGEDAPDEYELRILARDGRRLTMEVKPRVIQFRGRPATMAVMRDISRRKDAEEDLRHRIEMEKVVTDISTKFINLASDEIEPEINNALKALGEFSGVDRTYVFRFSDDQLRMDNTHEWCAEGIESQIQRLQGLSVDDFPWWMSKLRRFENIHIPRVYDLPSEAHEEKQTLQSQEIQSLIVVPMVYGEVLKGFLGFDSVREEKAWKEEDGAMLKIVAEIFVHALERKRVEEALLESEEKYRSLVEQSVQGIVILQDNRIVFTNEAFAKISGYTIEELHFLSLEEVIKMTHPDDRELVWGSISERLKDKAGPQKHQYRGIRKDESECWLEMYANQITYKGRPAVQGTFVDVTERKFWEKQREEMEKQLRWAQKMEAIGTLAGGIAHDFNNLLMGILGNVSLMLFDTESTHQHYEMLKSVEEQVQMGSKLTNQLLGYARKGSYEIKPIDLNQLVLETSEAFERARKEIVVHRELCENLMAIEADKGQIEQVLWNLYLNAADAMPDGGKLALRTRNVSHKDIGDRLYEPKLGKYVLLTVTDTGVGMDEETIRRIFEPFFTTKEMGRGVGLGLASAYGIVKGHGGYIDVDSAKGSGTTFSIYLPATEESIPKSIKVAEKLMKGDETILLVDDEETVLEIGIRMLKALGYEVLKAKNGKEALDVYASNQDKIALVILDMIMPGMGGGATYNGLKEINPAVSVILSSGYSIDSKAKEILERGCNAFIQKPFNLNTLSRKIREILQTN